MITFKYKDKVISTPNLEKKLKRMKLSLEDIEIIDTPIKETPKEETISDTHYKVTIKGPDNSYYIGWITKNEDPPDPPLQSLKWNPISKTGIRRITDEYIAQCIRIYS